MTLILSGTDGLSDVDGSAATPAIRGTDANTGIFFPAADTIAFSEGGAEAMRIDSSGRVGIGTSSPAAKLDVRGSSSFLINATNPTAWVSVDSALTTGAMYNQWNTTSNVGITGTYTNHAHTFVTNNTERMRIDSSGNLLVGTTSGGNNARLKSKVTANTYGLEVTDEAQSDFIVAPLSGGVCRVGPSAGAMAFYASNTECARIDSSGNLLVGTTSSGGVGFTVGTDAAGRILTSNVSAVPFDVYLFKNNGTTVGKITINTASTAYTTTSDYRLKENISPISGALDVVSQLKPVNYTWKLSGEATQGFIAHELQAVVPDCVVGEKDAVDAEGNPQYQGVDTSFLVATLTAAIQEQQALITALTARIESLETK